MIKNRIYYAVLLILSALLLYLTPHRVSAAFMAALVIVPAVSLVMFLGAYLSFKHEYSVDVKTVVRNQAVRVKFSARCGWLFSFAYVKLSDKKSEVVKTAACVYNRKVIFDYDKTCRHIGFENVAFESVTLYDMLGLIKLNKNAKRVEVGVLPQILSVNGVEFNRGDSNEIISSTPTMKKDNILVSNIRDYQQDDNMRSIHWKLSSKMNKLMVKNHENISQLGLIVIADVSADEQCIDRVIECAVSVVKHSVDCHTTSKIMMHNIEQSIKDGKEFDALMRKTLYIKQGGDGFNDHIQKFLEQNKMPCCILTVTSNLTKEFNDRVDGLRKLGYTVYTIAVDKRAKQTVNNAAQICVVPAEKACEIRF